MTKIYEPQNHPRIEATIELDRNIHIYDIDKSPPNLSLVLILRHHEPITIYLDEAHPRKLVQCGGLSLKDITTNTEVFTSTKTMCRAEPPKHHHVAVPERYLYTLYPDIPTSVTVPFGPDDRRPMPGSPLARTHESVLLADSKPQPESEPVRENHAVSPLTNTSSHTSTSSTITNSVKSYNTNTPNRSQCPSPIPSPSPPPSSSSSSSSLSSTLSSPSPPTPPPTGPLPSITGVDGLQPRHQYALRMNRQWWALRTHGATWAVTWWQPGTKAQVLAQQQQRPSAGRDIKFGVPPRAEIRFAVAEFEVRFVCVRDDFEEEVVRCGGGEVSE